MRFERRNFDWSLFWLLQVVFLGVPSLVTVMEFRGGGVTLSLRTAAFLVFVLIGLTVLNVIIGLLRASVADRFRKF